MKPELGFPVTEYKDRVRKAWKAMADAEIDGLLLTREADVRYFSGFQTAFWQSPTRPWFLFVPADAKPIAVIPDIGAGLMAETWIDDIRTWSAPCPDDEGLSQLVDLLKPYASRNARIGVPMGHETVLRMPLADWSRLNALLSGLSFVDATSLINGLRWVKSAREIEKIGHICAIASKTFGEARSLFAPGQKLIDAFRAFRIRCLENGADEVPYLVGGAGGGGYRGVIAPPTTRPLQDGDILMLDTGSVFDGYYCDFDRNFAIGEPDTQSQKAYERLYQATEAGLDAARPGATCRDVFEAMNRLLSDRPGDAGRVGRFGHGLGMVLTEGPSLAAFDDTVLVENMVITLEPSLAYGNGRMMVHEENIAMTQDGNRLLTERAPADMPVIQ